MLVKNQKKKLERDEEKLKNDNRDLSLVKMKSMFATGFAFTALLSMFNSMYVPLSPDSYFMAYLITTYFFLPLSASTVVLSPACRSLPSPGSRA